MRLVPVDPNRWYPTSITCIHCGVRRDSSVMVADLDGEPFRAYYCPDCIPEGVEE